MKSKTRACLMLFAAAALALCTVGCGDEQPSPAQAAMLAAQGYYRQLLSGESHQFLAGKAGGDSLPAPYREQLLTACRQFAAQQQKAHGTVSEVRATQAAVDTIDGRSASVFLVLSFADSTAEEIVVPMVLSDAGRWLMK